MTTATLTLADFLLARIAEYEWSLRLATDYECWDGVDRERAECAAKREIVSLHTALEGEDADPSCGDVETPCRTLQALAAVYSDHPDYRDEWRA